jgi:hypothetical protein
MGIFDNINKSEKKIINFMEAVENEINSTNEDDFVLNLPMKKRILDQSRADCTQACLHDLLAKAYKDALPLSDGYKAVKNAEIINRFDDFLDRKCPEGLELYIREKIKRSPYAEKVINAVESLVNETFDPVEEELNNNPDEVPEEKITFTVDSPDYVKKINVIGKNLTPGEITQIVKQNVIDSAKHEIQSAIDEKQRLKDIESQLANDINVTSPAAVESALEIEDIGTVKDYIPTLFNGIMINKVNNISHKFESGERSEEYMFNALESFGIKSENEDKSIHYADIEELAFSEAIEEYTALELFNTLKLESMNFKAIEDLALEYAQAK